jgi:hypothetical protein
VVQARNDIALKESALAIRLLGQGKGIALLRDMSPHDETVHGRPRRDEFFFFPTLDESLRLGVKAGVQADFDKAAAHHRETIGRVRFSVYAVVRAAAEFTSLDAIDAIYDEHPYQREWVAQQFEKAGGHLWLWVVRAHVLTSSLSLVERPMYDGSRRWVKLEGPLPTKGARPVVPDDVFARRVASLRNKLTVSQIATSSAAISGR